MSLRGFHIFFISLVVVLAFGIGATAMRVGFDEKFGILCGSFGAIIAVYGVWFIRKSRKLIL